jgi:hypothetical protein
MAYVIAAPEMMTSAATDLATIGANVSAAHTVAAAPTVAVVPAAADEVSASVAHLFSQHAANYHAQAAQAAAFQEQFVQHLTTSAGWYAVTEAGNAALLQPLTGYFATLFQQLDAIVTDSIATPIFKYLALAGIFSVIVALLLFVFVLIPLYTGANHLLSPFLMQLNSLLKQILTF